MKITRYIPSLLVAAVLASGAAQATTVELLSNGSFERNTQKSGTWNIYSGLIGWTGGSYGVELRNNVAGVAADGVNYVELDTTANSSISQSVKTTANQAYTLSFAFDNRAGVASASQGLEVLWGGVVVGSVNNSAGGNWQTVTYTLLGNGKNETLTFRALGASDSYGTSLDRVSLTAAVPEPETYAMMLAGLGMVGMLARRRRKQ